MADAQAADDVEEETPRVVVPRLVHDLLALKHERDASGPSRAVDGAESGLEPAVMPVVGLEDLPHRARHGNLGPLQRAFLQTVREHDFFADDEPRNFARRPRFRVRSIRRSFGNPRQHLAGGGIFLGPQLQKQRFFVHRDLSSVLPDGERSIGENIAKVKPGADRAVRVGQHWPFDGKFTERGSLFLGSSIRPTVRAVKQRCTARTSSSGRIGFRKMQETDR